MSGPHHYKFSKTVDLYFWFVRETVAARMMHLTGASEGCSANGMLYYSSEIRWHIRKAFERLKK